MIYTVTFRSSVAKDMRHMPQNMIERIKAVLRSLAENPFPEGHIKIKEYEHIYRVRIGNYRIVYEVQTKLRIIAVVYVRHRKDVYRDL